MKVGPKSSLRPFLHRALQLFANAIAQQAILPQAISIWGSKSSLHLHRDTQISAKNRIKYKILD